MPKPGLLPYPQGDAAGSAGGANAGAAISGAMEPEKSEKPRKKSKWDQVGTCGWGWHVGDGGIAILIYFDGIIGGFLMDV